MARIRTVKPDFFRHHGLYELEQKTKLPIRVAFAGLFTCADREGKFKWVSKQLKLDCLPYDELDFEQVLNALKEAGFIFKYSVKDRSYGIIPSFNEHQKIRPDEAKSVIPDPQDINEQNEVIDDLDISATISEQPNTICSEFNTTIDESDTTCIEPNTSSNQSTTTCNETVTDPYRGKERKGIGKEIERKGKEIGTASVEPTPLDNNLKKISIKNKVSARSDPHLVMPFHSAAFLELWQEWKVYRQREHRKSYKCTKTEQAALVYLSELSEGQEQKAMQIIARSIANQWQGFFPLQKPYQHEARINSTTGNYSSNSKTGTVENAFAAIDAMPD